MKVTVTGAGFNVSTERMRRVVQRLGDATTLVAALTARSAESQRGFIDKSVTPSGRAYKPLSPDYARWKVAHGFPATPLKRTLIMYNSIRPYVVSPRSGWAGPSGIEAPYFPYQNQGRAGRVFIGISAEDKAAFRRLAEAFARGVL